MLFGSSGFFSYGSKQRAVIPLVTGIALCFLPYLFAHVTLLVLSGVALLWFVRT